MSEYVAIYVPVKYRSRSVPTALLKSSLQRQHTVINLITALSALTLLHSERPKLHTILAFLSATGLRLSKEWQILEVNFFSYKRTFQRIIIYQKKQV